jgi:archaellum biogenesis ATPase FlaH
MGTYFNDVANAAPELAGASLLKTVRGAAPPKEDCKKARLSGLRITIDENTAIPRLDLIGGLFPRGYLTFIAAQQGKGKSWLVERLAVDLSIGGAILDGFHSGEPARRVLFLAGESRYGQFIRRAKQMRWDITQETLLLYDHWESQKQGITFDIDMPEGRENIELLLADKKPDIVFLDSFFHYHNSDESKADAMKPVMSFLNNIAEKYNLAVVASHHNRKRKTSEQKSELTQDEMTGSNILHKNAAVILMLQGKPVTDSYGAVINDAVLVRCEKSWARKPAPFAFAVEDEGGGFHTSMRIVLNPENPGETKLEKIIETVEASFDAGTWFTKFELKRICGDVNERTVIRALEEMQSNGQLTDNGKVTRGRAFSRTGLRFVTSAPK